MAEFYVSQSGDNSDGLSLATAWTSVGQAIANIKASYNTSVNNLWVNGGVYTEVYGGSTYWFCSSQLANRLNVKAYNGGTVIIKGGTSSAVSVSFSRASNIYFYGIKFVPQSSNPSEMIQFDKDCSYMGFVECTFDDTGRTRVGASLIKFIASSAPSTPLLDMVFDRCQFIRPNNASSGGAAVWNAETTSADWLNGVLFKKCTFDIQTLNSFVLDFQHRSEGVRLIDSSITHKNSNVVTVRLGVDNSQSDYAGGGCSVENTIIEKRDAMLPATSHAVLLGGGCVGSRIVDCRVYGGDYGIVLKSMGQECKNNIVIAEDEGQDSSIICRGAYDAKIDSNILIGSPIGIHIDDSGTLYGKYGQIINNIIWVSNHGSPQDGKAACIMIDGPHIPDWIVDYNCYWGSATGGVYSLRTDPDSANLYKSLEDAKTYWDTYGTDVDCSGNDHHSIFADPRFQDMVNEKFLTWPDSPVINTALVSRGYANIGGVQHRVPVEAVGARALRNRVRVSESEIGL